jgi:heterodisulfide reductase subunit B
MQFDTVQKTYLAGRGKDRQLPAILYPRLSGLSTGIDKELLGLNENKLSILEIEDFFKVSEAIEA